MLQLSAMLIQKMRYSSEHEAFKCASNLLKQMDGSRIKTIDALVSSPAKLLKNDTKKKVKKHVFALMRSKTDPEISAGSGSFVAIPRFSQMSPNQWQHELGAAQVPYHFIPILCINQKVEISC